MTPRRISPFFVLATILMAGGAVRGTAQAATIYVSPSGSDSNTGTIGAPLATAAQAVSNASPGDTIYLRAGTYTLTQPLNITTDNLTLASYTGETASITGTITDLNVLLYMIYVTSNNVSLVGLDISGGSYFGVKLQSNAGTVIQNCHIHDNGCDNIKMYLADNVLFEACDMGPTGDRDPTDAQCINAVACNGGVVHDCHLHDSVQNGVYFKGGSTGCLIEQNLVERCAYAGILLGQDTDLEFMRDGTQFEAINCVARNNIVENAGGAGIGTWSGDNIQVEDNTLYNVAQTYNGGLYIAWNSRNVPSQQITFKNNIVVVTSSRPMFFSIGLSDRLMSDYNLYFNPAGTYPFWEETATSGNYWTSFSAWQSGMASDLHSITGQNPNLNTANLYKPESGSPALGAGVVLTGVTDDYAGDPRPQSGPFDIGAWQISQAVKQPPQVSVTSSTTSGQAPLSVNFVSTVTDQDATVSSYSWTFGDGQTSSAQSPSHIYTSAGDFTATLTVTDSDRMQGAASVNIAAQEPTSPTGQSVNWTNIVGCSAAGPTLSKTAPTAWGNAGAGSTGSIASGDGFVMFGASENGAQRIIGLANRNYAQSWGDVAFGILLNDDGTFGVNEPGQSTASLGAYAIGDIFEVSVESGLVKYYRNGSVVFTSGTKPSYPLWAAAVLGTSGATVDSAVMSSSSDLDVAVEIANPGPQQVVKAKSGIKISWSVTGGQTGGVTEIMFSDNGGANWSIIALGLPGKTTSYTWGVATSKTNNALIRVVWQSPGGFLVAGTSGMFTVKAAKKTSR
jgi:PKD repeat protein